MAEEDQDVSADHDLSTSFDNIDDAKSDGASDDMFMGFDVLAEPDADNNVREAGLVIRCLRANIDRKTLKI